MVAKIGQKAAALLLSAMDRLVPLLTAVRASSDKLAARR